jgi:hypothetical protein
MKKLLISLTIMGMAVIFSMPEVYARQCCGGQGQGWRHYDRATVETIKGTVVDVKTYDRGGIHVSLKADKGSVDVYVGPAYYLEKKIKIARGDVISVTGSRVTYDGAAAIIAREVEKGGVTVQLRKDDGTPLWAGHGRWRR